MKIRAILPNNGYFVEVTEKEMANLLGEHSFFNATGLREDLKKAISSEIDIPVSRIYQKSSDLKDLIKMNRVQSVKRDLEKLLEILKLFEDTATLINSAFEQKILDEINKK